MQKLLIGLVVAAAVVTASFWFGRSSGEQFSLVDCGVDQAERDRLMALDVQSFDQDFDGGWRAVSYRDGCERAAAELISAYIDQNSVTAEDSLFDTMAWHVGQMYASAGFAEEAVSWMRRSFRPDDETRLLWRLYAEGTIAFRERDQEALQAARDHLAAQTVSEEEKAARRQFLADNPRISMPPGFVDEPQNLNVLDGLLACFDETYERAYGRGCQERARR